MTPEQQSESFRAKVRELIDAGELSCEDADKALDSLVRDARLGKELGKKG